MIPELKNFFDCNPVNQAACPSGGGIPRIPGAQDFTSLASIVSGIVNIVSFIAIFLTFYFLVWGAWSYIFAGGEKEALGKARERIKWALIGLLVLLMAYTIATYAGEIFPSKGGLPF